ncbi:MAG TPA: glycerol kinase GlpK [Firmicutes bacterium]|nr:glycerol kinase GlpK [Bacillota bacterium]
MPRRYILAIDQGTTGTTVIVFDEQGGIKSRMYQEFRQYYPQPGWVEHDALEIWEGTTSLISLALAELPKPAQLAAIGITNQRETVVLWDRKTGLPVTKAIVWQCRRTASLCDELKAGGLEPLFQEKTGLVLDPYFSGTKLKWLFDQRPDLKKRAQQGELAFGTIDSWLIYKLTGGKRHVTDYTNASRTLLFNIAELKWDEELLEILAVPAEILPEVVSSSEVYGETARCENLPAGIPVAAAAGDQQAALFGQACFQSGMAKATFGTGAFMLMNTGPDLIRSKKGLLTTIAWGLDGKIEYALEGSVFVAGAAVQWLRDEMQIVEYAAQTEAMAQAVPDTNGIYFVPAFVGLGAPHWDPYARGAIVGISRGVNRNHVVRAALEAVVYQTKEVLDVMAAEAKLPITELRVDGGVSVNNFICQFLADMAGVRVQRPRVFETTALGAAFLAGLAVGVWRSQEDLKKTWQAERIYAPAFTKAEQERLFAGWQKALGRAKNWINPE